MCLQFFVFFVFFVCVFSFLCYFPFFILCIVRPSSSPSTSGWYTTRRRNNRIDRPPSPAVLNLSEEPELRRLLLERTENELMPPPPPPPPPPMASTTPAAVAATTTTSEATAATTTEAAEAAMETKNEFAATREPDRLSQSISYAYFAFIKMYREEAKYDNSGVTKRSTSKHSQMMSKMDKHFFDMNPIRLLDPELVEYVCGLNVYTLDGLERQKVTCFKLEMDRVRFLSRNQNQFRHRKGRNHHLKCLICLKQYTPDVEVTLLECGHTSCTDCINEIYSTPDLRNRCAECRCLLGSTDKHIKLKFMFNYFLDPICRFCESPFDKNECYALECGHALHTKCLHANKIFCLACEKPITKKAMKVYLDIA